MVARLPCPRCPSKEGPLAVKQHAITNRVRMLLETESDQHVSDRNRDQLLPPAQERDRTCKHAVATVEVPQLLAGTRVESVEIAARSRGENQVPGRGQHTRPRRRQDAVLPLDL